MSKDINRGKSPILIMIAMEMEANILIDRLENKRIKKIYKFTFYEGTILGCPVIICLSDVGTRNASIATYIAIERYHPFVVLNAGTAGGHGKIIHSGDIVIVEDCFNMISGRSQIKTEGEGSNSLDWNLLTFTGNSGNTFQLLSGDTNLINIAKIIKNPYGRIYVGRIGSGDFWNREADKILFLNKEYNTLGEDMECIAVYNIAHDFDVPVLGIKAISNNEILGETFDSKIAKVPQEFTYELISHIIKDIR